MAALTLPRPSVTGNAGGACHTRPVGPWAVVLAAGSGSRFGSRKQHALLGGRRLVDRAVELCAAACEGVVLVLPPGTTWDGRPVDAVVAGGATRAGSVRNALAAVPAAAEVVVVHDAAHPLASRALLEAVVAAVEAGADAATPVLPATDTSGRLDGDGALVEVTPRAGVVTLQMPHAFRAAVLRAAHEHGEEASDDTSAVVVRGHRVATVAGDPTNVHVTTEADLDAARALVGAPAWSSRLDGRSVLVTGASGLIGSHLLPELTRLGATVHAVSRAPRRGDGVHWHVADLTAPGAADHLVEAAGADAVVHLAGEVVGARSLDVVLPTLEANLVATVRLLEAAARRRCQRVVLAGSFYQEPAEADAAPPAPYGASKHALRGYAAMFGSLFDLPVVTLRPTMAYGPAQSDTTKVVPYATLALLRGEAPELSSGTWEVDWVYAGDVARAFALALTAPGAGGRTIDVGSGQTASVRTVVERVDAAVAGPAHPVFGARPDRSGERSVPPDLDLAWRLLRWEARVGLDEGVRRTVAWYRGATEDPTVAALPQRGV